jgi:outer membrane protein OmpA-like peptidoglycan-associated protein
LLIAHRDSAKSVPQLQSSLAGQGEKRMKRILVPAACLLLAACGGGPRYSNYSAPPPPPEATPTQPYQPPRTAEPPQPYRPVVPQTIASAGPLKTAMVGSYMDNQEQDLRRMLRGTGALVARPGDDIVLHLKSDEIFSGNSFDISEAGERILADIAPILRHYDHTQIYIDAFTDTSGSADKNLEVSRKRAYTVGGQLVKFGVPLARLQAKGYGEENLKIKTGDQKNEPRNRRIEIRIAARPMG